LFSKLILMFVL